MILNEKKMNLAMHVKRVLFFFLFSLGLINQTNTRSSIPIFLTKREKKNIKIKRSLIFK